MQKLWQLGSATVTGLQTAVNEDREEGISRNTIQGQLQRLEDKGWVEHSAAGRSFIYKATVAESEGTTELARDFRNKVFGGSSLAMVRCLVDSGDITEGEIAELKQLINKPQKS